jgi:hypothetical protein
MSLSISTEKVNTICWAIRGQPQLGLRRFISTTASMSSFFGPLGQADARAWAKTTCDTFVFSARYGDAAESRLQNDGGAENACRAHEKSAQTGDDTIRGAEIGRTLAASIQDSQLMFDEHRLGNDGTEASWPC